VVLVIMGASFLLLSLICGSALLVHARRRRALEAVGTWTTGRVELLDLHSDGGMIIVAFEDDAGRMRKVFSPSSSSFHPHVGEPARVLYDPRDPSRAEIDVASKTTRVALVLMTCAFAVVGVATLAAGLMRG
jgi:hypothetical protein